jgi:pentatricopeptide repeat protein
MLLDEEKRKLFWWSQSCKTKSPLRFGGVCCLVKKGDWKIVDKLFKHMLEKHQYERINLVIQRRIMSL